MTLKKCPRCELNYILDGGDLCTVCHEEVHGKPKQEAHSYLCSLCGERAVVKGQEMCAQCLAELRAVEIAATGTEDDEATTKVSDLEQDSLDEYEDLDAMEDTGDEDTVPTEDTDEDEPPVRYRKAQ